MSTTSTVENAARPEIGKYAKRLSNLSRTEARLLVKHYTKTYDKSANRTQLLTCLFICRPEFRENATEKFAMFEIYETQDGEKRIRYHDGDRTDEFQERPTSTTQIDIAAILVDLNREETENTDKKIETDSLDGDQLKMEETEKTTDNQKSLYSTPFPQARFLPKPGMDLPRFDEPHNEQTIINSCLVSTLNTISDRLTSTKKRPFVSKNLQYDESEDISNFFTKVTAAAIGQGLTTDADKVSLATQVLSTSTVGSQLLGLCNPDDYTDWSRFCNKLLRMTGTSYKTYEQQFLAYKRLPGQSSSLLMAKLIDLYRRSCEYSESTKLNKYEEKHIRMRFILCLEPELQSLLEDRLSGTDSDKLTLQYVAEKCSELECYYKLGSNKKPTVNVIRNKTLQEGQFETLLNAIKSMNQPKKSRINDTLLKGYCLRHVKGSCSFKDKCRYKHTQAPEDVLAHMKEKYNVEPKSA